MLDKIARLPFRYKALAASQVLVFVYVVKRRGEMQSEAAELSKAKEEARLRMEAIRDAAGKK